MLSCELSFISSESLLCCLIVRKGVLHSEGNPGSALICPITLPPGEVTICSFGCSSVVRSVEPDPEPVDDWRNRFLLMLGDNGHEEGDRDLR